MTTFDGGRLTGDGATLTTERPGGQRQARQSGPPSERRDAQRPLVQRIIRDRS